LAEVLARLSSYPYTYVYMYMYVYIYIPLIHIYIYIHNEREREKERERLCLHSLTGPFGRGSFAMIFLPEHASRGRHLPVAIELTLLDM